MADLPAILTSNSAYGTWHACNRRRYWGYEAENGTATRGWERQRLSLPLSTGSWSHKIAQGLLVIASGGDMGGLWAEVVGEAHPELADALKREPLPPAGIPAVQWIGQCSIGYQFEARIRGLDLGLSMDGQLPEERFVERTIAEQSALLEAFGWAYQRVRVPRIVEEYEILGIEQEEYTLLSGDVGLQSRCDVVLRRRSDQRLFIYNLKTSGNPDKRWHDQFEVDSQLMTETLAVERRLGERVYGVVIDGFDKGQRVGMDFQTLKEIKGSPKEGQEPWYAQRSRLIYGYKCEDIPGRPTLYDYEGTTRKGWRKFAVWEETAFPNMLGHIQGPFTIETMPKPVWRPQSQIEYWVNWLPVEQVEGAFITLPPIMRSDRTVDSAVRQIVAVEKTIRVRREDVDSWQQHPAYEQESSLDAAFPQNFRACVYPSKCWAYALCHENAAADPASNGFQPRKSNHPLLEAE